MVSFNEYRIFEDIFETQIGQDKKCMESSKS